MDLLKGFGEKGVCLKGEKLDEEDVQLSLGLSSNGRFGVDRRKLVVNHNNNNNNDNNINRLVRCSSIADFSSFSSETEDPTSLTLNSPLTRTCSLPVETEAEWRKRRELQSLRRSEAKRKRVEKLKNGNGRVVKGLSPEGNCEVKRRSLMTVDQPRRSPPPSLLPPIPRPPAFPSPVSVGSPASGGSSGVSDLESQPFSGTNKDIELKSTATQQPDTHQIVKQPVMHQIAGTIPNRSNSIPSQTTSSQTINRSLSKDETLKMMFADMPCVSTKGDGVNGKKIEGFLYRYRKGEEVRIVCVCHGSFLTPAEFVKHGGGGDVEHPLRHIVVVPRAL